MKQDSAENKSTDAENGGQNRDQGEGSRLAVTGMTCANCAANIERSVRKLPGIRSADVNFGAEQLNVDYDPGRLSMTEIVEQVKKA
ncbi:MAG: cation transporter, partial [Thermodesulfobacteriota bacterium]